MPATQTDDGFAPAAPPQANGLGKQQMLVQVLGPLAATLLGPR